MTNNIKWESYDADLVSPVIRANLTSFVEEAVRANGLKAGDDHALKQLAETKAELYKNSSEIALNDVLGISIFRPHEFDAVVENDAALRMLAESIKAMTVDWRKGSKNVQDYIKKQFRSGRSAVISGGRDKVILDAIIEIGGVVVAVEVETSINIDNGMFTLRQAVRTGRAKFGVMIVPFTAEGSGRADEGKATGRLDREFDSAKHLSDGPIYRIAIVREIDVWRHWLREHP